MNNLKKISGLFILSLIAISISFASCDSDDDNDDKSVLSFSSEKVEIKIGDADSVKVSGGTAPYSAVSGNIELATVKVEKDSIIITGVSKGTTSITVTDNNNNIGTISVTVKQTTGLDFDKETLEVNVNEEGIVTVEGGVAPYAAISQNSEIASVSAVSENKITIKGKKAGTTTITVKDKDEENSGTISVTVKE